MSAEMKPIKAKEGKQRSYYNVKFDNKDRTIDAELATSLVLQYLYYLFLRNEDINFTTYPFTLSKVLTTPRQVVIAVFLSFMKSVTPRRSPSTTPNRTSGVSRSRCPSPTSARPVFSAKASRWRWTTATARRRTASSPRRAARFCSATWAATARR